MLGLITSWLTPTFLFVLLNLMIGTIFIISRFTSHKKPQHDQYQHQELVRAPSLLDRVKSIDFSLYKFPSSDFNTYYNFLHQPAEPEQHTNRVGVDQPTLIRAPSLLERVKSINFSSLHTSDPPNPNPNPNPEPGQHTNRVGVDPPTLTRAPSLLDRVKSINFSSLYTSHPPNPNPEPEAETHTEPDPDADPGESKDHEVKRSKSERNLGPERVVVAEKIKKSASEKTVVVERTASFGEGGDHSVDAKADDFINRFKQQLKLQRLDSLLRYRGK